MLSRSIAHRRATSALIALAASLLCLVAWAAPASAHSTLTGSNPAEGDILDVAPAEIILEFNETVQLRIDDTVLTAGTGESVPLRAEDETGSTIVLKIDGELNAGQHALQWSVAAADGHPISGVIRFSTLNGPAVETPATDAPSTTQAPAVVDPTIVTETSEPETTDDSTVETTAAPDASEPDDDADDANDDEGGLSAAALIFGLLILIAVVGAVVVVARGGSRSEKTD